MTGIEIEIDTGEVIYMCRCIYSTLLNPVDISSRILLRGCVCVCVSLAKKNSEKSLALASRNWSAFLDFNVRSGFCLASLEI